MLFSTAHLVQLILLYLLEFYNTGFSKPIKRGIILKFIKVKNLETKKLDSFLSKQVKDVKDVKGGMLGESCYIIVRGVRVYC